MINGNSSRQSAALPTSLWVDGDNSSRQSTAGASSAKVTGIVVALPEELSTLSKQKLARGECLAVSGDMLIAYAGAGPLNAERAAKLLIEKGANRLISWGCAAALAPNLSPGDLVIAEQAISEQHQSYRTDAPWSLHLQNLLNQQLCITTGILAESSVIVADSGAKQDIHRQTGAVALDMESVAVIKVAEAANLPSLIIRAIADPVTMNLPQAVVHALNAQGQVELPKLLRYLLTHPWEIPALIKLGLHFNAAQKTLKTVAKQISEINQF